MLRNANISQRFCRADSGSRMSKSVLFLSMLDEGPKDAQA